MNILIAASYSAPFGGNFIGSMQDLGSRIRERGDEVFFLFPKLKDTERPWVNWLRESGYEVILADLNESGKQQADFLRDVIKTYRIDLAHLHFEIYNSLLLHDPSAFAGCKVLIHDHMGYATGRNEWRQKARLALNSAKFGPRGYGLITVWKRKKNAYILMSKKWYVPNGLSLKRQVAQFADRDRTRAELGIGDDQLLVTLLGWDMKRKGVDIAVQAVSRLYSKGENVVLGLIGGDMEKYHEFIRQYGVDPDSPFIRYINSREDIYSLHRAADVFLSASRNEGFPYSILEAVSQETPVVVSSIPETKWALQYKKCAMYPVEDEKACSEAIARALSFGGGDSNADEIIKQYSIDKWCDSILDKYDKMMRK
ncbi:MAG: glycosyltransferase family 4 protein [Clostridiales bacterium]|nr:glycosyltransferase family 4 protein [Clostridiales bacterium]